MKKIFFRNIKKLSVDSFKKMKSERLLKLITDGNIIIIRKAINKNKILKICKKIDNSKLKKSRTTKMYQGIKNIYYEAEAPLNIKKTNNKRYIVSNRSWYFFPWNNDKFNLVKLVQPIFNKVINLNGYNHKRILKNTPRNGIIQRFHLMNYPYGTGFISRHVDPSSIVKATAGIYITEYWKDYDKGGFYVLNEKKKKVVIDKYVRSSDMVLFYSSMPHGVDSIYKKNFKTKSNIDGGRWFLNMTLVSSHHVKNRLTSKGY